MKYNWVEIITGFVVLALALYFGTIAFRAIGLVSPNDNYPLYAEFVSAEGVTSGGEIRMAGVRVGRVGDMDLDRENYTAYVELLINDGIRIPLDSEAKISTTGFIGNSFVEIIPGADLAMLESGGEFTYVSSSVSLIGLFSGLLAGNAEEN